MPTKPLVSQQHEACQNSCGIPAADTATVTGDDPESWRDEAVSGSYPFVLVLSLTVLVDIGIVVEEESHLRDASELHDRHGQGTRGSQGHSPSDHRSVCFPLRTL
jgi:hypothetical protein